MKALPLKVIINVKSFVHATDVDMDTEDDADTRAMTLAPWLAKK